MSGHGSFTVEAIDNSKNPAACFDGQGSILKNAEKTQLIHKILFENPENAGRRRLCGI